MAKYDLHGCTIEVSDDGRTATVSKDGRVLETFRCADVLECLTSKQPTPTVQAHRFAKGYVPPKPEPEKKKQPEKKTGEDKL